MTDSEVDTQPDPAVGRPPRRPSTPVGDGPDAERGPSPWHRRLLRRQESAVLLALVLSVVFFTAAKPGSFATSANLQNLTKDAAVLLILSVGVTYVTVMGMFDLSIGSVLVFSQVAAVRVMGQLGADGLRACAIGLLVALASGMAWGALNGVLVCRLGLSPFIVTLATLGAALGAAQLVTGGGDLSTVPVQLADAIGLGTSFGVPNLVWMSVLVALVGGVVLARTRFGRLTYAIGSSAEAARRAGIAVDRHVVAVYVLMGAIAGFAGYLSAARFGVTSIGGHGNDALQAITAVALGGGSLYGGVGTVLGTVIGVSIPAVLQNGLIILGTQPYWYQIIVAAALIASIYLDRRRRQLERRG